jgi:dTDP-4-dehydrorhamnose 3,5-epimerase
MKPKSRDSATVDAKGNSLAKVPHGVTFRNAVTHFDDRGSVCELYDERWDWHSAPLVFSYIFTLRPNRVKGWGMHMHHEDRYIVLRGEMIVVMYDSREDSPTKGLVSQVHLSEWNRRLMNIPIGIWHVNWNPGSTEALVNNFPTRAYDHDNPDKYRLPIDTDQIPFKFPPDVYGW